jgi:fructokinase
MMFGGIEGGGTKFNCVAGTSPEDIRFEERIPTTTPEETLGRAIAFFKKAEAETGRLSALGIACFGPLDPEPASSTYGRILPTPKPGWSNADVVGRMKSAFDIPIAFDTDVNGAALGEWKWGAAQGLDTFIYLTVGTGIGGGVMANGQLVHGLLHFEGACPFHKDCFEGLASGPAIENRWGQKAETLPPDHPAWELEVHYISQALMNYIMTLSPQRIIIGGGISSREFLFPMIRQKIRELLNNYVQSPAVGEHMDEYIVPPGLGGRSGMLGALAMAQMA